jgi:glycosyltransferase involved in cell wall biosynthesis
MEALAAEDFELSVMAYPVNKEAPFEFEDSDRKANYFNREKFSDKGILQFLNEKEPDMVVCSGWIDKGYLKALKHYSQNTIKVLALDNQIEKGLKAKASMLRAKTIYKPYFDCVWVPGPPQADFARSMGFSDNQIWQKFYTADFDHFSKLDLNAERNSFPKRFVYVGRYVDFKGINELFSAFQEVKSNGWELFCAGTGELFNQRPVHPNIHHLGFVQPAELDNFVREGGVFVLPSWKEPWGVVIHEFASAGYPLICSEKVGAGFVFLKHEKNGYHVKPRDKESLKDALERIISTPDKMLFEMGALSKELASSYTISDWVSTAKEILENE